MYGIINIRLTCHVLATVKCIYCFFKLCKKEKLYYFSQLATVTYCITIQLTNSTHENICRRGVNILYTPIFCLSLRSLT